MVKPFRPYDLDQRLLLPPDLREWLPDDHLALFVSDVVDGLDLSAILDTYESGDGRGQPPYHPAMIVKLLLYAYCVGKPSSRKIERATYEDVAYRVLAADQHPMTALPRFGSGISRRWRGCSRRSSGSARKPAS